MVKSARHCILSFLISPMLTLPNVSSGQWLVNAEFRVDSNTQTKQSETLMQETGIDIKQRSVSQPKMCVRKLETWYYLPVCFTSRSRASLRRNTQDSPAVEMRQERILQLFSSKREFTFAFLFFLSLFPSHIDPKTQ